MPTYIQKLSILLFSLIIIISMGCGGDDPIIDSTKMDQFDRSEMLAHWADGFIIPGYQAYVDDLNNLKKAVGNFNNNPNENLLFELRNEWVKSYTQWQQISVFEIGKAEEIGIRNFTNIYPTNADKIISNLSSLNYNLELPSTIDQQGFPAIEYLLYGIGDSDSDILNIYKDGTEGAKYSIYLDDLVSRLVDMSTQVLNDWTINGYREIFISDDGSSASSSVNRLVNDFLFYYERYLRAAKIGIPAGVFSGNILPQNIEAPYASPRISKILFLTSLDNTQNFFNGVSLYTGVGPSLSSYLDYIRDLNDGPDISAVINSGLTDAKDKSSALDIDFADQINTDNVKMLEVYDALQTVTVLLKTDMLSALNIKVDYIDADGD